MSEHTQNDLLAAEYVLGTLRGPARRRFERLMNADPAVTVQVGRWQQEFGMLDALDTPVQPPGRVWHTIQSRLPPLENDGKALHDSPVGRSPASAPVRSPRVMQSMKTRVAANGWQVASFILAASLVGVLLWPHAQVPNTAGPVSLPVAVLASAQGAGNQQIVASFDARSRRLTLTPLNLAPPGKGHSLQLWLIAKAQKPASLGLLKPGTSTVIALGETRLSSQATLAVSLEPEGGSPTGQPTGAVLYAGKLGKI